MWTPGAVNVCVNVCPGFRVAENELSSATTVWFVESWFVHTTVLFTPSITVMFAGLKNWPLLGFWAPETMLTLATFAFIVLIVDVLCAIAAGTTKANTPNAMVAASTANWGMFLPACVLPVRLLTAKFESYLCQDI